MDFTLEETISHYKNAAIEYGEVSYGSDSDKINRLHDIIINCYLKLKFEGEEAVLQLRSFMNSEDESLALWAATHILPYDESNAVKTLEKIRDSDNQLSFDAKYTLIEWKSGNLSLEYPDFKID